MYLPLQTHIAPLVTVRRERRLPVPGELLVGMNDKVSATDVVARAAVSPDHRLLDFSRALGLPPDVADRHLACQAGDEVSVGDTLAGPVGLMRRRFRAPVDGRVVAAGDGQVLLEAAVELFRLRAGIPGVVVNLDARYGVTIETSGALIQAQWGNGRRGPRYSSRYQTFGVLQMLAESREDELTPDMIDVSHRGAVLAASACADPEALRLADEIKPRGLILGTLDARLHKQAASLPFPVVLIDGFGHGGGSHRRMNPPAFELLRSNAGREVAVDALPTDRYAGHRPEVIIPLSAVATGESVGLPPEGEKLAPGQRVRVLRAPCQGQVGLVVRLFDRRRRLPSGVRAYAATVQLDEAGSMLVPFANLEILE